VALFTDQDVEEKDEPSMVRLPQTLWDALTRIATVEEKRVRAMNPKAKKVSRNDVIKKVLADFVTRYDAETKPGSKRGH
jgi:hypothetical protein